MLLAMDGVALQRPKFENFNGRLWVIIFAWYYSVIKGWGGIAKAEDLTV